MNRNRNNTTRLRPRQRADRPVNGTVLGSVLGAVGFVCISAIIIVLILKKRKRDKIRSANAAEVNYVAEPDQGKADSFSGVYECVGPALPERNQEVVIPNKHNPHMEQHNLKDTSGILNATYVADQDNDTYLEPLSNDKLNENYIELNHAVYSAADDPSNMQQIAEKVNSPPG